MDRTRTDFVDNFDTGHRLKLGTVFEHRHYDQYRCTDFKAEKIIIVMDGRAVEGRKPESRYDNAKLLLPCLAFFPFYLLFSIVSFFEALLLYAMPCHSMM